MASGPATRHISGKHHYTYGDKRGKQTREGPSSRLLDILPFNTVIFGGPCHVFVKHYLVQCNFTIAMSAAWLCARLNLTNFEGEVARFMNQYDHGTVDNRKDFSFP